MSVTEASLCFGVEQMMKVSKFLVAGNWQKSFNLKLWFRISYEVIFSILTNFQQPQTPSCHSATMVRRGFTFAGMGKGGRFLWRHFKIEV